MDRPKEQGFPTSAVATSDPSILVVFSSFSIGCRLWQENQLYTGGKKKLKIF